MNVTNSKLTDYNKLMDDGVKSSITNIRSGIEDLGTSLSDFNTNIGQSSATLNDNIDSLNENIIKRLHLFNDEIREIDELINKFLDITKNRIIP